MVIMEYISYERCAEKSITEVKMYILRLMNAEQYQGVHDILNRSIDVKQLQRRISKRTDISLQIFDKIKLKIDQASNFLEVENHLVFMNVLLCPTFAPLISYKYNLFERICNGDFTVQKYCVIRHLLSLKDNELTDFVMYMCQMANKTAQEYHYIAVEILCIEHQFDDAYRHLKHVTLDEHLEKYKTALYHYSPYKFRKVTTPSRKGLWQLLSYRKGRVWENDYFTY
jgi:hypothetical protein